MNERIKELALQVGAVKNVLAMGRHDGVLFTETELEKFAELIINECAACCGSQADMRNIRKRFGLPVESNVKYPSPDAIGHYSQYGREYNIPKE
jgi:hypothetical protein